MDILKYKGYEGTAELDISRGICRGKILCIKDLVTYESETAGGLREAFEAAVEDYLETCKELGREPAKPFRGQFNVRVPKELHRAAVVRAAEDDISLNDVVVRSLEAFLSSSSEIQHHHHHVVMLTEDTQQFKSLTSGVSEQPKWESTHYAH